MTAMSVMMYMKMIIGEYREEERGRGKKEIAMNETEGIVMSSMVVGVSVVSVVPMMVW